MEKPQSLADFLGTSDAEPAAPSQCLDALTVEDFCRGILSSREYRQSVLHRITLGILPPAVELRFYDYAVGKPVDRVEVKDTTVPVEQLTAADLEDRSLRLAEMARLMRRAEQFDEPLHSDSVH